MVFARQGRTLVAVDVHELMPLPVCDWIYGGRSVKRMQKLVLRGPTGAIEIRPSPVLFGKQMRFEVD